MTTVDSHQTLVDYCYKTLRSKIICGDFAPGEKLQIAKLKACLNSGPTPIREALSRLSSSGLVEVEENKGFRVKNISEVEVKDLYATFNKIEILALSQAIDLGDASWEANILASLHKLSLVEKAQSPIDPFVWLQHNHDFHYSLIVGCRSPCLLKIREDLYQLFDRYCHLSFLTDKHTLISNHKDHCDLAKATIHRHKEKACKLMTLHLEHSLEQVMKKLKQDNRFLTH